MAVLSRVQVRPLTLTERTPWGFGAVQKCRGSNHSAVPHMRVIGQLSGRVHLGWLNQGSINENSNSLVPHGTVSCVGAGAR